MLAGSIHLQLERGVVSAVPMQDHLKEAALDAHDDLVQCRAQDPLARCCCRSRVRPGEFEIGTELQQVPPLLLTQARWLSRLERGGLALEPVHDLQCLVPAALQLTGDQAIVGIDGVVLPTGMRRREARLLQRQIELPLGRRRLARFSLERLRGGIDAERLQDPKNLATDSVIGTQTTEPDAPLRAVVHKSALAVIAPRLAPIAHVQLAAAMATTQQTSKKQLAAPHRASDRGTALTGRIVGNHLLVPRELAPGDIAVVLILE